MTALPMSQIMDPVNGAAARYAQESVYGHTTASLLRAHQRIRRLEGTDVLYRKIPLGITTDNLHAHVARFGINGYIFLWSADNTNLLDDAPQWRHNSINIRTNCDAMRVMVRRQCFAICDEATVETTPIPVECPTTPRWSSGNICTPVGPGPLALEDAKPAAVKLGEMVTSGGTKVTFTAKPVPAGATLGITAPTTRKPCTKCGDSGKMPNPARRGGRPKRTAAGVGGVAMAIFGAMMPGMGLGMGDLHTALVAVGAAFAAVIAADRIGLIEFPEDAVPCCWCCQDTPQVMVPVPTVYLQACGEDNQCYALWASPCASPVCNTDPDCHTPECEPCDEPEAAQNPAGVLRDTAEVCPTEVVL